jgi:predicted flap endonuclease-1-like 5' DNA nuclease
MRFRIVDLRGIGPQDTKALKKAGVMYAEQLKQTDINKLSVDSGISKEKLSKWKNYVIFMGIRTIGPHYAILLHRPDVGINSIQELAKCSSNELLTKIIESNKRKRLVKVLPTIKKVENWIEIAKNGKLRSSA